MNKYGYKKGEMAVISSSRNPVAKHMNQVCKPSTHANKAYKGYPVGLHRLEVDHALDELLDGNLEDFEGLPDVGCSSIEIEED